MAKPGLSILVLLLVAASPAVGPARSQTGMPADVAKQLAAFGTEFDGGIAGQTAKIYASQPRVYDPARIKITKNLAYGPHERQQVDIHVATVRRSDRPMPVVVVFHGGGLSAAAGRPRQTSRTTSRASATSASTAVTGSRPTRSGPRAPATSVRPSPG